MEKKKSKAPPRPLLRITVGFLGCPDLDKNAARYLILSQNLFQDVIEFGTIDLDDYSEEIELDVPHHKRKMDPDEYVERATEAIGKMKNHVEETWKEDTGLLDKRAKWFLVTEVPFADNLYSYGGPDLWALSLSDWKKTMAPPSILEFILRQTQVAALIFLDASRDHFEVKGCLGDFSVSLEDTRLHVLVGHLCHDCSNTIQRKYGVEALNAFRALTDRSWIGTTEKHDSIASILKKVFGYDLFLTKGFAPSWGDKIKNILLTTTVQEITKLTAAILLAWALIELGLKA